MSSIAIANSQDQSTLQSSGHRNNILKNLSSGNAIQSLLSNTASTIEPAPTGNGMNRNHANQQHQQASNGNPNQQDNAGYLQPANPAMNLNNAVAMPMNQNSGHSNQQGQSAWLQHMILNPIGPLGGNDTGMIQNQANQFSQQQQVQRNFTGNVNAPAFQQQPQQFSTQLGGAIPLVKQQPTLSQPTMASQSQQQPQNLQQSLSLNLQPSVAMQATQATPLQQQQQGVASMSNKSQLPSISNNITTPSSAQQQQQLLLLALMLQQQQQQSNNNIDTTALTNAFSSTEGLRLLNSLLTGQQLPQVQGNQVEQQQHQTTQVFQGQTAVPTTNSLLLPTVQQQDGLSMLLSQQHNQQQNQMPNQAQPQVSTQPIQLPSLSILNQSSLTANRFGQNGDSSTANGSMALQFPSSSEAISNLKMPADSKSLLDVSSIGKGRGISLPVPSLKNDTNTKDSKTPTLNSRFPRLLYCDSDDSILGEYQTLLRQQLELFEADSHDVINGTFRQGRTTPIRLGQIGLRCKHCAKAPLSTRTKGSVYFSQTIKGMYQIGQNMSKVHLCERCPRIPPDIKKRMVKLRSRRHRASGGRAYWIRHLREMGLYEDGTVLRAYPPGVNEKTRTTTKPASAKK